MYYYDDKRDALSNPFQNSQVLSTGTIFERPFVLLLTAAWLVQLVERQSAVREIDGSSPRPDQHSGS